MDDDVTGIFRQALPGHAGLRRRLAVPPSRRAFAHLVAVPPFHPTSLVAVPPIHPTSLVAVPPIHPTSRHRHSVPLYPRPGINPVHDSTFVLTLTHFTPIGVVVVTWFYQSIAPPFHAGPLL
jgi:hypothetical protein